MHTNLPLLLSATTDGDGMAAAAVIVEPELPPVDSIVVSIKFSCYKRTVI